MQLLRLVFLLLVTPTLLSVVRAQSTSAEAVTHDFVAAWNAHETAGFERLFTTDAVWVPVAEVRDVGREAILKDLMQAHTTWAKHSKIRREGESTVVHPRPDVAVIFFRMKFLDAKDQVIPGVERAMVIVATQASDGWRISAGQLTKESPPPKP